LRKLLANIWTILIHTEKRRLLALAIAIVLINVIDISCLALLVLIVNFYTVADAQLPNFIPLWLQDKSSLNLIGFFLIVFTIKSILGYFVMRFQYKFIYNVASRLSGENLLRYLEGSFIDYVTIDSAVQIRSISQQPVEFAHYVLSGLLQMFTEFVLIILTVIAILLFDARLFLLLLVLLFPAVILISFFARRKLKHVKAHVRTSGEKAIQFLQEALSGYIESNIYNRKKFFARRYAEYQKILNNYLSDLQVIQGLPARTVEVFAVFGLFILLAINKSGQSGLISIVTIGAFIAAAYKIIPGIVKVVNLNNQVRTYFFTTEKLGYHSSEASPKINQGTIASIELRRISFKYHDELILKDATLNIRKGEMLGISAPSGKGKTTLINILLGFLEESSGEIIINGVHADTLERRKFWPEIAYVKQQPFLIHNSIRANIVLEEKGADEQLLQSAVQYTGLDDFINKQDAGIDMIITENGKNISGGQRQRVALARAFYKNASLIILDEAFNEMDEASETSILKYLQSFCAEGKMVILITHNKKSLSFCSKIYKFNEG